MRAASHHCILHAKRSRTKVACSADPILHRGIQPMQLVIGLLQLRNPLGPGAVEDQLNVVMAVLELLDGF